MRYLGNKTSILEALEEVVATNIKTSIKKLSFFDAFSGTAAVGDYFSDKFEIIANDKYYYSYVYTRGKLNNSNVTFEKLGFCPFKHFNKKTLKLNYDGFIFNNYAPKKSGRMYFSDENAALIDTIRVTVEEWKKNQKINDNEYYYLLASLLESVSTVANIAGVYGAYLKTWDPRAVKKMEFIRVESINKNENAKVYNDDINKIINKIDHDILYLDPPYTKNQYSTQYHILETIAKYDNPEIRGVTGTRSDKIGSEWSREIKVEIELNKLIKNSNAKYVIMSYSSLGIMEREYIESFLKRYSKTGTVETYEIDYKKYRNSRTKSNKKNVEYIFFIEKKKTEEVNFVSPLNYMGSKEKMIDIIKKQLPKNINTFYDIFGGGFNVGINITANEIVYNDYNFKVKELIEMFLKNDTFSLIKKIEGIIKKYSLEKENKENYIKARKDYNHPEPPLRNPIQLYTVLLYGFQQQIRFNSKYEFNNPVGQSSYNTNVKEKIVSFSETMKNKNIRFLSDDFEEFNNFEKNDFVYCDPPYLITLGSYNDGKRGFKGWNDIEEKRLLNYLSELNQNNIKFLLSNVIEHRGKTNTILTDWIKKNKFEVVECGTINGRKEVLIKNY